MRVGDGVALTMRWRVPVVGFSYPRACLIWLQLSVASLRSAPAHTPAFPSPPAHMPDLHAMPFTPPIPSTPAIPQSWARLLLPPTPSLHIILDILVLVDQVDESVRVGVRVVEPRHTVLDVYLLDHL